MTRSKDKGSSIDEGLMVAIRQIIKEENKPLCDKIDSAISKLEALNSKYSDIEKGLTDCAAKIEKTLSDFLPLLSDKVAETATLLSMRMIEMDCHRRKWSLIIQGMKGGPYEKSHETTQKCIELAKSHLNIKEASPSDFAACHRLNGNENSGIIIRFLSLTMRDRWLAGAKGPAGYPGKISISPDLPPVVRSLRKDLASERKSLPLTDKRKSLIRYLKSWPFVELVIKDKPKIQPRVKKDNVVQSFLGIPLHLKFDLNSLSDKE